MINTQFDFSGTRQFLAHLDGKISLEQVLDHPAYKAVFRHAQMFGTNITTQDVEAALADQPSPFYGLGTLRDNLSGIAALLDLLDECQSGWCAAIETELMHLFPSESMNITLYPIIGYDMGIGLDGSVCMNLNHTAYLNTPMEFLFYAIHECTHVIYERRHHIPTLAEVCTPAQWRSYFNLWTQNEGFAVYAPLRLREKLGALNERDYQVLFSASQLEIHRLAYWHALERLSEEKLLPRDEYLEICFGEMRLTYRIGCNLLQCIEHSCGLEAVREAFMSDSNDFIERHKFLLLEQIG